MKGTFALKADDESAGLGHLGRIIFDHILGLQRTADLGWGYFALEHALHRVDSVENLGHGLIILCRTHRHCEEGTCSFRRSNPITTRRLPRRGMHPPRNDIIRKNVKMTHT